MLATLGTLPTSSGWAYEMKWDGMRAVLYVADTVRILTRNDRDVTSSFPELAARAAALTVGPVILDGEIVACDATGVPDFGLLQGRIHVRTPTARLVRAAPTRALIFDVLHLGAESTLRLPYHHRRALLAGLGLDSEEFGVPPHYTDDGAVVQTAAEQFGLEGVVAKRLASAYQPGVRSRAWIKVPRFETVEVIVGGWTPGADRRRGLIGALLVGTRSHHRLIFAGAVGSGFSDAELIRLAGLLAPLQVDSSPFDTPVPHEYARHAVWVKPLLGGEARFRNWTADGLLRHPSWRGLRTHQAI